MPRKSGAEYGPVSVGPAKSSGTNASRTSKSMLAEPRSPRPSQVSWSVTSSRGKTAKTCAWPPSCGLGTGFSSVSYTSERPMKCVA